MKKGKSVKLKLFTPIKTSYGTVDSKNLKSLYINIQSWVTPKYETDNWNRVVGILTREIKHSVFNSINTEFFREQTIVDLDLRTSGISTGKKSFFNLEVNLYVKSPLEFKSKEVKDSVKSIVKSIFKDNILTNKYFNFSLTKKPEPNKVDEPIYLSKKP
jgi:hypothetical protein